MKNFGFWLLAFLLVATVVLLSIVARVVYFPKESSVRENARHYLVTVEHDGHKWIVLSQYRRGVHFDHHPDCKCNARQSVRATHGKVEAIGHMVNDDWFYQAKDFAEKEEAE